MSLLKELLDQVAVTEQRPVPPDPSEELSELFEIYEEMMDLMDRTRAVLRKLPADARDRAEREWFAEWRALMNDEHPYVNRKGWTFKDTIDSLGDDDEEPEE
jgi:hypothetical protein